MPGMRINSLARAIFVAAGVSLVASPANASPNKGRDGRALLQMCKGADKVRALGVMCHSYVNGYLDTVAQLGKSSFCFKETDKELVPPMLVLWLNAHPEQLTLPAPEVLSRVFAANYPCKK
jgi:hypothetical protein